MHALDAEMIFLVDHQADLLAAVDGHAAGALAFGMFAADQLPLDQKLPVDAFQLADVDILQLAGDLDLQNRGRAAAARFRCGPDRWRG